MITACATNSPCSSPGALHTTFLSIVPRLEAHGRVYFRRLKESFPVAIVRNAAATSAAPTRQHRG